MWAWRFPLLASTSRRTSARTSSGSLRLTARGCTRSSKGRTYRSTRSPAAGRRPGSATSCSGRNTTFCVRRPQGLPRLSICACQRGTRTSCSASAPPRQSSSASCLSTHGRLSPHVNIGFTISGEGSRPETLVDQARTASATNSISQAVWNGVAHPKLTVLGDILGWMLFDGGKIELESRTFPVRVGSGADATVPLQTSTINPISGEPYRQLALKTGNLSQMLGALGFSTTPAPTCCSWRTCSSRSTAQGSTIA